MRSRRIRIGCEFTYVAEIDTPVIFQVQPSESPALALQGERPVRQPVCPGGAFRWPVKFAVGRGG